MKDHVNFLKAARIVLEARPDVRFICVGSGDAKYAESLKRQSDELGLEKSLIWLSAQKDTIPVYSGMDIVQMHSLFSLPQKR
jgi:glycosyltransferase involved in cell wall biosynthesis